MIQLQMEIQYVKKTEYNYQWLQTDFKDVGKTREQFKRAEDPYLTQFREKENKDLNAKMKPESMRWKYWQIP